MKVLITGGSTRIMIDEVRCMTNIFKGRTAHDMARHAFKNGWEVNLMTSRPRNGFGGVGTFIPYETYDELYQLMKSWIEENDYDVIIHSAAVSDYRVDDIMRMADSNPIALESLGQFEVMHKIGEYEWEMSCGPYKTHKEAEQARLNWFKKDEINQMRVVLFMPCMSSTAKTPTKQEK